MKGSKYMELVLIILSILISYVVIQIAIDKSINTTLQKENLKILIEIRDLLKNQSKNL